ncbi:hypothetical protein V2G26_014337 [Clonostachys chloroleuca]
MRFSQVISSIAIAASTADAAPRGSGFFRWYGKNTGARNEDSSSLESENRVLEQLRNNFHRAIGQNGTSNSTVTLTTTQTQTATLELSISELTKPTAMPAQEGGDLVCPSGTLFISTTTIDVTVYVTATPTDEPTASLTVSREPNTVVGQKFEAATVTSTLTVSLAQNSDTSASAPSSAGQGASLSQATASSLPTSGSASGPSSVSAPSASATTASQNMSAPALQTSSAQVSTSESLVVTTTLEENQTSSTLTNTSATESATETTAAVETPSPSSVPAETPSAAGTPSASADVETPSSAVETSSTSSVETPSAIETPSPAIETPSSAIETPSSSPVETPSISPIETPSSSPDIETPSSPIETEARETPSASPDFTSSSIPVVTRSSSSVETPCPSPDVGASITPSPVETSSGPLETSSSRPTLIWTPYSMTPSPTPAERVSYTSSKTSKFSTATSSSDDVEAPTSTRKPTPTRKPAPTNGVDINIPEPCIDPDMAPVTSSKLTETPAIALPAPVKTVGAAALTPGAPEKTSTYCGVNGKPAGVYFLAEFIEERAGVPVSQEGCYQFCDSVMDSTEGCQAYRFYHNKMGAPRCELYGMPVSWSVDELDQKVEGKWFDLSCGSPTVKKWQSS